MTVIDRALERLDEELRVHDFGAENEKDLAYWAAYLDGARAQKCEDDAEIAKLNGIIDVFVKDAPEEDNGTEDSYDLHDEGADALEEAVQNWKYASDMLFLALQVTGLSMTALTKIYEMERKEQTDE